MGGPFLHIDKKLQPRLLNFQLVVPLEYDPQSIMRRVKKKALHDELMKGFRALQISRNEADWQAGKPERIKDIMGKMNTQIQIHLIGWVEKVDEAINDAEEPSDKNSLAYWVIALVGNLIWAATSIKWISTRQKFSVPMSFVGATLGSGTVEKISDLRTDTKENRKESIKAMVALLQNDYETDFLNARSIWAEEFDSRRIQTDIDIALQGFLWDKMFPVPFGDGTGRYFHVYVNAKKNIEKLLVRFKKEWEEWKAGSEVIDLSDGLGPHSFRKVGGDDFPDTFTPDLRSEVNEMAGSIIRI